MTVLFNMDNELYCILTNYYSKKSYKYLINDFNIETDILVLKSAIQGILNSSKIVCDREFSVRLKEVEIEKMNA